MIPIWLYASDGRALYCVYVTIPQPVAVTYAGVIFYWSTQNHRYEQAQPPFADGGVTPLTAAAAPLDSTSQAD